MEHVKNIIIGIILGVSNVIPGVSAGTMAVIFGIYDKLLDSITANVEKLKSRLPFLITVVAGMGIGILMFSNIISYLYANYSMATNFTFIGLVVGSIPMIWRESKSNGKLKMVHIIPFIVTLLIMLAMALSPEQNNQQVIVELDTIGIIRLLVAGALSAFSMIIPGISGSFIMLVLGVYATVIHAISTFNLLIIAVVGIGAVIGIVGGTGLVKLLLKRYRQSTYMAILGLVIGSIFVIYPGFTLNGEGIVSLIMLVVGAFIALYFSKN